MKANKLLADRTLWIGFAMVMIVLYHISNCRTESLPYALALLARFGYGGVDICVLASGIGCFYSLSRCNDEMSFYKKRFMRIMPTYFCFIVFWIAFKMFTAPLPMTDILGNFFGLQAFTEQGNYFNWYMSLIILLYVMSPMFFGLAKNVKGIIWHMLIIGILLVISVAFWDTKALITMSSRFPIFYMGMIFAKYCMEDKKLNGGMAAGALFGAAAGYVALLFFAAYYSPLLWRKGLYWYPFILITPGLCLTISYFRMLAEKCGPGRFLIKAVEKIGDYSFEVYLTHLFVFELLPYPNTYIGMNNNSGLYWFIALFITALSAAALRKLTNIAVSCAGKLYKLAARTA